MRIAVCLIGQPSGWNTAQPAIKFFYNQQVMDVDYFISVTQYNIVDNVAVFVSDDEMRDILQSYSPKSSVIDIHHEAAASFVGVTSLKRQHEISNNFEYDMVVYHGLGSVPTVTLPTRMPYMTVYSPALRQSIKVDDEFATGLDDSVLITDTHGGDALAAAYYAAFSGVDYACNSNSSLVVRLCNENNINLQELPS